MSTGPSATRKVAIVSISAADPTPSILTFQYNPATLQRTLRPQMVGGEENDRSEAVRFSGAPVQEIKVDIQVDATDALDAGDATAEQFGTLPQLAALELLIYPTLHQVSRNEAQLAAGIMEVAPMTAPRTIFVWGSQRALPVRLESYSIVEQLFDRNLRPVRATASLSMRVLNHSDLNSSNPEYHDFSVYHQNLRSLAGKAGSGPRPWIGVDPGSL